MNKSFEIKVDIHFLDVTKHLSKFKVQANCLLVFQSL